MSIPLDPQRLNDNSGHDLFLFSMLFLNLHSNFHNLCLSYLQTSKHENLPDDTLLFFLLKDSGTFKWLAKQCFSHNIGIFNCYFFTSVSTYLMSGIKSYYCLSPSRLFVFHEHSYGYQRRILERL